MSPTDVAELMNELLETDDIAVDDNFFDMGGSSVLALRLLLELTRRHGVSLSLIDVMHHPTAEGLAQRGTELAAAGGNSRQGEPA
ncbi:MAG: acyl carrier protein [Actinobacteria bacterium]|nr:acyl carrier protein [Actinomycetota bacterium]